MILTGVGDLCVLMVVNFACLKLTNDLAFITAVFVVEIRVGNKSASRYRKNLVQFIQQYTVLAAIQKPVIQIRNPPYHSSFPLSQQRNTFGYTTVNQHRP